MLDSQLQGNELVDQAQAASLHFLSSCVKMLTPTLCKKAVIPCYNKCVCRRYSLVTQRNSITGVIRTWYTTCVHRKSIHHMCITWFCNTDYCITLLQIMGVYIPNNFSICKRIYTLLRTSPFGSMRVLWSTGTGISWTACKSTSRHAGTCMV